MFNIPRVLAGLGEALTFDGNLRKRPKTSFLIFTIVLPSSPYTNAWPIFAIFALIPWERGGNKSLCEERKEPFAVPLIVFR